MLATNLTEANGTCTGGTTEEFYVQCNAANKLLGGCKDKDGSTCVIRAKPRDIMLAFNVVAKGHLAITLNDNFGYLGSS